MKQIYSHISQFLCDRLRPAKYSLIVIFLLNSIMGVERVGAQSGINPALPNGADPDIQYFAGKYYIYPTGGNVFHAYSSADLTNWQPEGPILDLPSQVPWGTHSGWAPCMVYRNNKYYFYFTANYRIGVAVGNTPVGPFTQIVQLLGPSDAVVQDVIDPAVFVDTDGQAYFYYGGSAGARMGVRKLNADMISFDSSFGVQDKTPPYYTEAPHMIKRGNIYHLTYSNGSYANGTYNVRYCTSTSPIGPWTYRGQILSNVGPFTGNGHNAIVKRPGCDEYYMAYHRYENGDYTIRKVGVDRVYFDTSTGLMMPVSPTWAGVPARPASAPCITPNPIPNGTYWIQSRLNLSTGAAAVVAINGCNKPAGTSVVMETANTMCYNQRWVITYSNNFYKIKSAEPNGYSLDLGNCGLNTGTNIGVWHDLVSDCQRWRIEETGTPGYYRIMSKHSGHVLDYGSTVAGANVLTWNWNAGASQLWRFSTSLPAPAPGMMQTQSSIESSESLSLEGDIYENKEFKVYPNPVNTRLNIEYGPKDSTEGTALYSKLTAKLYDDQGILILSEYGADEANILQLDTQKVPDGTYFLHIFSNRKLLSKRQIIIKH